jgi:hypothetical protein
MFANGAAVASPFLRFQALGRIHVRFLRIINRSVPQWFLAHRRERGGETDNVNDVWRLRDKRTGGERNQMARTGARYGCAPRRAKY